MIEDRDFVKQMIDTNQAFFKTIPNSKEYWSSRKKDVFAMMRQLGKPTAFLTISANEMNWPDLIRALHKWSPIIQTDDENDPCIFDRLSRYQKSQLVAEDPLICCVHFYRLLSKLILILQSKKSWNPFGNHCVIDYFIRIEFQQRGSVHAHLLLWLNDDPREKVESNMPRTVAIAEALCSASKNDLKNPELIKNQTHSHTFTCTKRGEKSCRFNTPYWPLKQTLILAPLAKNDNRRSLFKSKVPRFKSNVGQNWSRWYSTISKISWLQSIIRCPSI